MRFVLGLFLLCSVLRTHAQQLIFQENFTTGIPSSWYLVDEDNLTPASPVSEFSNAWIAYIHLGDTCAASTSYYDPAGQAADYLITPKISLDSYAKLVWSARSYDASYPEHYLVLISTTDSMPASFTDTLMSVGEEYYYWKKRSVQLDLEGYANQDVFIAFKNITDDGYVLMLDDVKVLSSDFASLPETEETIYTVYPNPASDYLYVNLRGNGETLTLYSTDGREVLQTAQTQVALNELPSGLYFYTIASGQELLQTGRIVVN